MIRPGPKTGAKLGQKPYLRWEIPMIDILAGELGQRNSFVEAAEKNLPMTCDTNHPHVSLKFRVAIYIVRNYNSKLS